jgi:Fic family protein
MRLPQSPPEQDALTLLGGDPHTWAAVARVGPVDARGRYLHWDQVRRRPPPAGLTHQQWWAGLKMGRRGLLEPFPLHDRHGRPFAVGTPKPVLRGLHRVDKDTAGQILLDDEAAHPGVRDRYLLSALMEEAITSSQLEGAATTREVAKGMLRSGRPPRTRDERMILNNFRVMERIRDLRGTALTPELVLELQAEVTDDALDDPSAVGRLRRPDEDVRVVDDEGRTLHNPPDADELSRRLAALCEFANEDGDDPFIHPVVRSILLHFWLAYDHPFVDGNGRTARAVFYWSMLRRGYWLFEFIPISRVIRKARSDYARAFLYAESDDNDATYFVVHQLRVIEQAIDDLQEYLKSKMREQRSLQTVLRDSVELNHRQRALLVHALGHDDRQYTIEGHRGSHGVAYQTARTDLLDLAERGLLRKIGRGKKFVFAPAPGLEARLRKLR